MQVYIKNICIKYFIHAILQYSMESRVELNKRISKIKGQVEGIERMLDNNRDTLDIVQQIVAVNSALKKVSIELLKTETSTCVSDQKKFESLLTSLFKIK